MYSFITILLILICILIGIVVLVQAPKGGGLAAGMGGTGTTNMFGGVQKASDFLERVTWTLAIAFFVLSILSTAFLEGGTATDTTAPATQMEQQLENEGQ